MNGIAPQPLQSSRAAQLWLHLCFEKGMRLLGVRWPGGALAYFRRRALSLNQSSYQGCCSFEGLDT